MVRSYPLKTAGERGAAVRFDLPATFVHPMFFTTTRSGLRSLSQHKSFFTFHSYRTTFVACYIALRRDRRHGVQQLGQAGEGSNRLSETEIRTCSGGQGAQETAK